MTPVSPRGCFVTGVAILLVYNVARGLGAFGPFDDASMLLVFAAFVLLARLAQLTAGDLGLAHADFGRGAIYGSAAFLVTAAALSVVALVPATSDFVEDARGDVSGWRLLFEIVVPVLVLTAIPEEFAFRGVMLASGRALWGDLGAAIVTSVLFGLWHISPTLGTMADNEQLGDARSTTGGTVLLVAGTVLATLGAGLVFSWLRLRSRSLVAPVIAHLGTNGVALVVAWLAVR